MIGSHKPLVRPFDPYPAQRPINNWLRLVKNAVFCNLRQTFFAIQDRAKVGSLFWGLYGILYAIWVAPNGNSYYTISFEKSRATSA